MSTPGSGPARYVVGLGNPGAAYAHTRHNLGFLVLDRIAGKDAGWSEQRTPLCRIAERSVEGRTGGLLWPLGYMNLSGPALLQATAGRQVEAQDLLVVYDDLALPVGAVRIRARGSSGGHRGLESILESLGTSEVPRLRIGIGGAPAETWREHVLSPIGPDEKDVLEPALEAAACACREFLAGADPDALARRWNRRPHPA